MDSEAKRALELLAKKWEDEADAYRAELAIVGTIKSIADLEAKVKRSRECVSDLRSVIASLE